MFLINLSGLFLSLTMALSYRANAATGLQDSPLRYKHKLRDAQFILIPLFGVLALCVEQTWYQIGALQHYGEFRPFLYKRILMLTLAYSYISWRAIIVKLGGTVLHS